MTWNWDTVVTLAPFAVLALVAVGVLAWMGWFWIADRLEWRRWRRGRGLPPPPMWGLR